jgi:hypothetical protein
LDEKPSLGLQIGSQGGLRKLTDLDIQEGQADAVMMI